VGQRVGHRGTYRQHRTAKALSAGSGYVMTQHRRCRRLTPKHSPDRRADAWAARAIDGPAQGSYGQTQATDLPKAWPAREVPRNRRTIYPDGVPKQNPTAFNAHNPAGQGERSSPIRFSLTAAELSYRLPPDRRVRRAAKPKTLDVTMWEIGGSSPERSAGRSFRPRVCKLNREPHGPIAP
jgi:hypothetical protein